MMTILHRIFIARKKLRKFKKKKQRCTSQNPNYLNILAIKKLKLILPKRLRSRFKTVTPITIQPAGRHLSIKIRRKKTSYTKEIAPLSPTQYPFNAVFPKAALLDESEVFAAQVRHGSALRRSAGTKKRAPEGRAIAKNIPAFAAVLKELRTGKWRPWVYPIKWKTMSLEEKIIQRQKKAIWEGKDMPEESNALTGQEGGVQTKEAFTFESIKKELKAGKWKPWIEPPEWAKMSSHERWTQVEKKKIWQAGNEAERVSRGKQKVGNEAERVSKEKQKVGNRAGRVSKEKQKVGNSAQRIYRGKHHAA